MSIGYTQYYCDDVKTNDYSHVLTENEKSKIGIDQSFGYIISSFYPRKIQFQNNSEFVLRISLRTSWEGELYSTGVLQPGQTSALSGCLSDDLIWHVVLIEKVDGCENNSDCEQGEKCDDGECVPCEEQQATHFQIRAEFEELVTLPDGSKTMYLQSSVYPIGSGVSQQIIQLSECNGVWYYPRIRFCDSAGKIKPYTGALSFYGYCNPDGSSAMWVNNFNVTEQSHLLGQKAQMDLHAASPLSIPRIYVEFIDQSSVIYEEDCSSVIPVEPPDIPPVEPDEPANRNIITYSL